MNRVLVAMGFVGLGVLVLWKLRARSVIPAAHRAVGGISPMRRYGQQMRPVAAGRVERTDVPHV